MGNGYIVSWQPIRNKLHQNKKAADQSKVTIAYYIIVHPAKIQKKNRTPSLIIVHPINKTKIISLKTVYKNRTPWTEKK